MLAGLYVACERLHCDGLAFVPSKYHIAIFGQHQHLRFVDPKAEERFRAFQEVLGDRPLSLATQMVAEGKVIDASTGKSFPWAPSPMVFPVSKKLREHLEERPEPTAGSYDLRLINDFQSESSS